MDEKEALALAQLLQLLIPMGARVYEQIRANHAAGANMPTTEQLLASSDAVLDGIAQKAQAELDKLKPTT